MTEMITDELLQRAGDVLREYFGASPAVTTSSDDFSKIAVGHIFGEVWSRPGLELRDRSLITLVAMIVAGRVPEMSYHIRGARRLGFTLQQLEEICLHLAYYVGFPAAGLALGVARGIYADPDAIKPAL